MKLYTAVAIMDPLARSLSGLFLSRLKHDARVSLSYAVGENLNLVQPEPQGTLLHLSNSEPPLQHGSSWQLYRDLEPEYRSRPR